MVKKTFLKHAFRSLKVRPLSSSLFVFIIVCVSTLFLILFSSHDVLVSTQLYNASKQFGETDFVIGLGNNYEQRFFSLQPLNEIEGKFHYIVPILVYPAKTVDHLNVTLYFADVEKLRLIIDLPVESIRYQEIYVLGNLATVNNFVQIDFQDTRFDFEIKGKLPHNRITKDATTPIIVLDKSLASTMIGLPAFSNMYNQVYLNLNENVDEEETLLLLKDLYPNQVVEKTKDINQIKRIAQQYSISIQLIMVLSFLPLTFTLFLLARINFKKNEKEMLILKILGTTKAKTFYFFFAEYVLYIIIGFLISLPIWYFLIKMMVTYLGDEALFLMTHPVKYIFVSFILVFVYISLFFLVFFHKLQRVNFCEASRQLNTKYEFTSLRHNKMIIPIITIFLFFIWMLLEYIIFPNMGVSISNHLLKAIAGFMVTSLLSLFMLRLLLQLMSLLFINKSRFVIIEIKEIIAQKLTFWLLSMAIFSIVTITVALHSYNQMEINANRTKEHLGFNLFITNITIKQDKYDSLLSSYSEIESYAKGFLYSKVHLPQYNHDLPLVLSVEPSKLTEFINYELEEEVLLQMQDQQKLSIILSHKYQKVYGLSIGDTIDLQINANQEVTKYLVAGFIPEEYDIYAFTNMYNNSESTSIHPFNAIFIKGYDENYLVNDLSKRIVADGAQVIKLENFFIELTRFIYNNQKFLFLFIVIVTICFVLVLVALFGFVFMEKKKQLTLLRALGDNPSLLTVIGKTMIVSAILMFISYLAIKLISPSIVSMVRVSEVDFSIVGIEKEFILVDIFISFLFGLMYLWEWTKKVMDQSILSH